MRTVADLFPSRRDLLGIGGIGLLGAWADATWPLPVHAATFQTNPRGTARNVIFFELAGAFSHVEGFDFKENLATPKDLDVREVKPGWHLSQKLLAKTSRHVDKLAVVRSLASHEEVHFRGQYYLQAGRQINLSFAREIPGVGSVIASELEPQRKTGENFPLYVSFNFDKGAVGALSTGFLPARFSAVDLNPESAVKGNPLDAKAVELIEQRWQLLSKLRDVNRDKVKRFGREMDGYESYFDAAHSLLTDAKWPNVFQVEEEDRKRYGNTGVGLSALFARNLLAQRGGTRYIHICHSGWDHHVRIWDHAAESNHYKLAAEFDPAFASLLEDLARMKLLDDTLIVCMSEFGRTPGALNSAHGRDHHNKVFPAVFAGAGVKGGRIIGASDKDGQFCAETGWKHKPQPRIENVMATIYSALGIDWSKEIRNTPSGRAYTYVDPLAANGYHPTDELSAIYG